ncbi:MAG: GAF domain-containing protein [Chthonomonadaceae bacterium]|nr:GAF domain-containing protein [Chthonomonadaceae bacterium]
MLDTVAEWPFDTLTALAAHMTGTPMSAVSLVDENRQWFKSRIGIEDVETERSVSFCTHAIETPEVFVVEDASRDPRFAECPLVVDGLQIKAYAGAPICVRGQNVGAFCVMDRRTHHFSEDDRAALSLLAGLTAWMFEHRSHYSRLLELAEKYVPDDELWTLAAS